MSAISLRAKADEPKFGLFLIISLFFHLIVLSFAIISAGKKPALDLRVESIQVNLYSPAEMPGAPKSASIEKEEKGKVPKPAISAPKTQAVKIPKEPTKAEISKSKGSGSGLTVSQEEKKLVQSAISNIAEELASKEGASLDGQWGALLGEISLDIGKSLYYQEAAGVYAQSWTVPPSVPINENLRVRVVVRIDKNGRVIDYQALIWSKNQALDRSVEKILEAVKELPPPPIPPGGQWFSLPMEFRPVQEE